MGHTPLRIDRKEGLFERKWVQWISYFLVWTATGLFFASESALWGRYVFRTPVTWDLALKTNLSFYYIWACIAPLVLWLGRRFRFERGSRTISLAVHLPTSVLLSSIQLLIAEIVVQSFSPDRLQLYEAFKAIQHTFVVYFHINLLTYWAILGIGYGREYYRKFREREVRAAQLKTQLTQAQLQSLKMQLHPHFLFNTFNTISSLMHKNVDDADRVLARLGDLLRYSLHNVGVQEVALREEIDFLQRYLEIEQTRFGDRLRVKINIDADVLDCKVPNLILQPLVENAIRYAVAPRASGGSIEISARQVIGSLRISVLDDGPGLIMEDGLPVHEGVGLRNSRERLEQLYGENHRFMLSNRSPKGLEVAMVIPMVAS
ncbi:MAG: histidine kinase [Ignavibacteriales bacterium]|nr:histidine kinase [Ignavibacteriales bacterium]